MNLNQKDAHVRLEQNEIVIQELLNKIQENEIEIQRYKNYCEDLERRMEYRGQTREPFVDIGAIGICSTIEKCLYDANQMLNDETIRKTIEKLVSSLFELILKQYNSKDISRLNLLKDSLIVKFDMVQKRLNGFNELNEKYKKIKAECESTKSPNAFKDLKIDNEQVSLILFELEKSRDKMETVQAKVIDQNRTIKRLNGQLDKFLSDTSAEGIIERPSPINSMPGDTYSTIKPTPSPRKIEPRVVQRPQQNRPNTNFYECPKCNIQIANDISFDIFEEHVKKCDKNKYTCMFCLKVFNENEYEIYMQHVLNVHNEQN
jgi:hypothetical protein